MVSALFLALPATFQRGGHIRVSILLDLASPRWARCMDIASLAISALLVISFIWAAGDMTWLSYLYHDVSLNLDRTPLWIPQSSMVVGLLALLFSIFEQAWLSLMGQAPMSSDTTH